MILQSKEVLMRRLKKERELNSDLVRQNIKLAEQNAQKAELIDSLKRDLLAQIETSMRLKKEALEWRKKYNKLKGELNDF